MGVGVRERPACGVTSRIRVAKVRFYFDADVLGTARIIAGLRPDATRVIRARPSTVGVGRRARCLRRRCPTPSGSRLSRTQGGSSSPATAASNTRAEIAAVRDAGAKMIALGGEEARGTWAQLEVLFTQWRTIERVADDAGPLIFSVVRSGLRRIPLD